jgi:4-hydroxybenzoate polyprenyltransferase
VAAPAALGRPLPHEPLRTLLAARVIHPFPVALNVAATVALAAIANDGLPAVGVLARLATAMFFVQAAIGASNDYCDRDLDVMTKPYKPIVRGAIEPRTALTVAVLCAIAAGAIASTFGLASVAAGAVGLAAGLAYNARLKRTVASALPFMVALPALPIWVWASVDTFTPELWWLVPFAPLAGLAVHLSNTLPDIESDRRAGVRGLAHTLGEARSRAVAWGSFALALALASALGLLLEYEWRAFAVGAGVAAALYATAVSAYVLRPSLIALQIGFGLIGMATAALATGWLAAVT